MHEFALATEIIQAATASAGRNRKIDAVHVSVERFGHIDPGILSDAFSTAAVGTTADGAELIIDLRATRCEACGETVPAGEWPTMCGCGALLLEGGIPEMAVTAVDVHD